MAGQMRRVAVLGGVRTPFCRSNTAYAELSNLDLMTAALNGLVDKYHLEGAADRRGRRRRGASPIRRTSIWRAKR